MPIGGVGRGGVGLAGDGEGEGVVEGVLDVCLRVPLLYFFDFLSNSLFLCVLLSIVGTHSLHFSGYSVQVDNSSWVVLYPKEIGLREAVFGWDGQCDRLWEHLSWPVFASLALIYFLCLVVTLVLFLSETNQLMDTVIYVIPSLFLIFTLYHVIAFNRNNFSSTTSSSSRVGTEPVVNPDSGNEQVVDFFTNSIILNTFQRIFAAMVSVLPSNSETDFGNKAELNVVSEPENQSYVSNSHLDVWGDMKLKGQSGFRSFFSITVYALYGLGAQKLFFMSRKYLYPTVVDKLKILKLPLALTFLSPSMQKLMALGGAQFNPGTIFAIFTPILVFELTVFLSLVFPTVVITVVHAIRSEKQSCADFGYVVVVTHHWRRLRVPEVVRCYWISRMAVFLVYTVVTLELWRMEGLGAGLWEGVRYLLARGCETWVAVGGMTTVVSSIGHCIGTFFLTILRPELNGQQPQGPPDDEETNGGSLTGILFLVLAAQTGLTELHPEKRLLKLYRNLWLLSMALLHFVHQMTDKVLQRVSTTGHFRRGAHIRGLAVSAFLLTVPWIYICLVWSSRENLWNPWLISVALFAFEVVMKMVISLLVYMLFVIDSWKGLKHLDDFVYWVKAIGASMELVFAVLLLVNGVWILLFEQSGVLRSVMIAVHAYCNIWLQAKKGWESFCRRWVAGKRLEQLVSPTPKFIEDNLKNEVCSICYQEWESSAGVKQTQCGHYYHKACLNKWLYVQDTCPMCHASILSPPPPPKQDDTQPE